MYGTGYRFLWIPAGEVVSSHSEYGATTAYGSQVQGMANQAVGFSPYYTAQIDNLAPGTYHYRVSATDAKGNKFTTPDATLEMPSVPTSISASRIYPANSTFVFVVYSTNRPVASTEVGTDSRRHMVEGGD